MQLQDKEGAILIRLKHLLSSSEANCSQEKEELMTNLREIQVFLEKQGIRAMPLPKELKGAAPKASYDSHEQYEHLMTSANEKLKVELAQQRAQISQLLEELDLLKQERQKLNTKNSRLMSDNTLLKIQLEKASSNNIPLVQSKTEQQKSPDNESSNNEEELRQEIQRLRQQVQSQAAQLSVMRTAPKNKLKRMTTEVAEKEAELRSIQAATDSALEIYDQVKAKLGPALELFNRKRLKLDPLSKTVKIEDLDGKEVVPEPKNEAEEEDK